LPPRFVSLRGLSAGDFQEALTALFGKDAPNVSPAVIARLKGEYRRWLQRDLVGAPLCLRLGGRRLPPGAHGASGRMHAGPNRRHARGQKGTGRLPDGPARERAELEGIACRDEGAGWQLRRKSPSATARSASGRRSTEAFPSTRQQRCWVHKTINVLDKLPKSVQSNAYRDLREIWMAPNRAAAEAAINVFATKYAPKYRNAVDCLIKDARELLTFYDFPADHWDHLRTSNPIESVFATVRHRTVRMKGALSPDTARVMAFKLVMAASKIWRRLKGQNQCRR
jgi:putative transposase